MSRWRSDNLFNTSPDVVRFDGRGDREAVLRKAGKPRRLTFRVDANSAASLGLAKHRRASKVNTSALHDDRVSSWANEIPFAQEEAMASLGGSCAVASVHNTYDVGKVGTRW